MSKTEDLGYGINNRFQLCLVANERAKIISGAKTTLDEKKAQILASEEIKQNLVNVDEIKKIIIEGEKTDEALVSEEISKKLMRFSLENEKKYTKLDRI